MLTFKVSRVFNKIDHWTDVSCVDKMPTAEEKSQSADKTETTSCRVNANWFISCTISFTIKYRKSSSAICTYTILPHFICNGWVEGIAGMVENR